MPKRISVIIPVYNVEKYLSECIESVLNQTYKNIEIILINDASTDKSGEICQQYADNHSNIIFIDCKENKGVVHARGLGLERATGEYIGFVDSDDWIEPEMYEKLAEAIEDVDLAVCGARRWESKNYCKQVFCGFAEGIYKGVDYKNYINTMLYDFENNICNKATPCIWDKLFKKSIMDMVYHEVDEGIVYAEDMILLFKYMFRCSSLRLISECLYNYRIINFSACNGVKNNRLMNIELVYNILKSDFSKYKADKELNSQLQKWVEVKVCQAINNVMGFESDIRIPQFIVEDISSISQNWIVLYGAGGAGQDYYWQLSKRNINIAAWVDKNYKKYQELGFDVISPKELEKINYDKIIITVQTESLAEQIKKELLNMDIPCEKIIWKKLLNIY